MTYKFFGVFFILALFVTAPAFAQTAERSAYETEPRACTQEAKLCPDGSYVSRTGPNCEFAACPTEAKTVSASGVVGERFVLDGSRSSDDGVVSSYRWRQVSGPFTFDIKEGAVLSVVPQIAGTYVFELSVTDSADIVSVSQKLSLKVGDPIPDIDLSVENDDLESTPDSSLVDGAEPVIINAIEVRGWDPEKKREFLETVKSHAELRSGQDLKDFAAGVLLKDENIEGLELAHEGLKMGYRMPTKLLGVFNALLRVRTEINNDGTIKVKFPWYGFLYRKYVSVGEIETDIASELDFSLSDWVVLSADGAARTGMILETMSNVLKARHEMTKSIIQNIRA